MDTSTAFVPTTSHLTGVDTTELPELQEQPVYNPAKDIVEQDDTDNRPVVGSRLALAFKTSSPTANLYRYFETPFFTPQEGFDVTQHRDLYTHLPEELWDDVTAAGSLEEAQFFSNRAKEHLDAQQKIMQGGAISGLGYTMLAQLIDPTMLIGGIGEAKALAGVLTKGQRLTRMAAIGGATAFVQEAQIAAGSPGVDSEDVGYATIGGMLAGAGFGMLMGKNALGDITHHAHAETKRITQTLQLEMDTALAKGKVVDLDLIAEDADMMGRVFDTPIEAPTFREGMSQEDLAELPMHMQATQRGENVKKQMVEDMRSVPTTDFENTRIGRVAVKLGLNDFVKMYKSGTSARWFAHHLLEDASGAGGRTKSAAILKDLEEKKLLNLGMKNMRTNYRGYAQELGISPGRNFKSYFGETRAKFNRELSMEMNLRRQAHYMKQDHVSPYSSTIQRQADDLQVMADEALSLGQRSGVRGFDDIERVPGYMPLKWMGTKMLKMSNSKLEAYSNLLSQGYQRANIPSDAADKIAKAVIRRAKTKTLGMDSNPVTMFSKDSRLALEDILREGGVSEQDMSSIMRSIDTAAEDRGKASFARRRTPIDLTTQGQYKGESISLMDIMDDDVQNVMTKYSMEVAGRSALARKGIASDADWRTMKEAVITSTPNEHLDRVNNIVDASYEHFLARPVAGGVNKNVRRLMDWAQMSSLGMVGIPQMAETATILAAHGVGTVFKAVPEMNVLRKGILKGDQEAVGVLKELDVHLGGIGNDHLLYRPEIRLQDVTPEDTGALQFIDNVVAAANDRLGFISGMNQIKSVQQQFIVKMQTDKVFQKLRDGMTEADRVRFADAGFDAGVLKRLQKQLDNGNVTFQANGAVDRLNIDKWESLLIEDFTVGIHRHTNQLIQRGMIGEDAYWTHNTLGSMLTQFRTFPLLAMQKQMVRHVRMADQEALSVFLYGTALSSAVSLAKAAAMDVGSEDKKRTKRILSPSGLLQSAMTYNTVLGLVPDITQSIGRIAGMPVLSGSAKARPVSLTSRAIPALSGPVKLAQATSALIQAAAPWSDRTINKRDIANTIGMAPLGNTYPAVLLMNQIQNLVD